MIVLLIQIELLERTGTWNLTSDNSSQDAHKCSLFTSTIVLNMPLNEVLLHYIIHNPNRYSSLILKLSFCY